MRNDVRGRKVQVRGRQLNMTNVDVAEFYALLAVQIPSVRFFDVTRVQEGVIEEMPKEDAFAISNRKLVHMFFPDGAWEPELGPAEHEKQDWKIINSPDLVAGIEAGGFRRQFVGSLGKNIWISNWRSLFTNNLETDDRGKRIINKVYRLHRKLVDNRALAIDLRSGDAVREQKLHNWYGKDKARECLENDDHYLEVWLSPDEDMYWGFLPADDRTACTLGDQA